MSQLRYWIWLSTLPGLSLRGQLQLMDHFGSPEAVFLADRDALTAVEGLTERERTALSRRDLRRANDVLEDCRKHQISILTIQDAAYPQRLRSIDTPPTVLYYKGRMLPFDTLPAVTVVGARNASGYGLNAAKRLGYQLGNCGGTVISGAARGIDSLALQGALSADAPVAAVLGNGLDIVYPQESKGVYADVMERGCLISEYPPGTPPLGQNFPRRNRIMSGLAVCVLVVEAAKKSGSLITAELALEQGRDVFAVPGNIGLECCAGSNQLIQDGAGLVTSGWDILQHYQARFPELIVRRGGGNQVTLAPRERLQPELQKVAAPVARPAPKPVEKPASETVQVPAEEEKRIDNAPKRNYIDLEQVKNSLSGDERLLVELLEQGPQAVDDLMDQSQIPPARVLASMTLLEVKGYVVRHPGNVFELTPIEN